MNKSCGCSECRSEPIENEQQKPQIKRSKKENNDQRKEMP
jgi:hypothetical protein